MKTYNILDFGASPEGKGPSTKAIQKAVDKCAENGGGIVEFPPGTFICGTIVLKDNVAIELDHGAIVKINRDEDDIMDAETLSYNPNADFETTYFNWALFHGNGMDNIAIRGGGIIDGNGYPRGGPKPIALKSCSNIEIKGITIRAAPNYAISMIDCEFVLIDGVKIQQALADGIDPDGCRNVVIANCMIESADDAIVPKTSPALGKLIHCVNLSVTNCLLATACFAFKLGTESSGDFRNISVSNCTMYSLGYTRAPIGGIALEAVDGSHIDGVAISNISMKNVMCPIFLRLGNRGRAQNPPTPGSLENVSISNVVAVNAEIPCTISGIPNHYIRHVNIDNVLVEYGIVQAEDKNALSVGLDIPEQIGGYPDPRMFGPLPVGGWLVRHAEDVRIHGQNIRMVPTDTRSMVLLDDVVDLQLKDAKFTWLPAANNPPIPATAPCFMIRDVRQSQFDTIQVHSGQPLTLKKVGDKNKDIEFLRTPFTEHL